MTIRKLYRIHRIKEHQHLTWTDPYNAGPDFPFDVCASQSESNDLMCMGIVGVHLQDEKCASRLLSEFAPEIEGMDTVFVNGGTRVAHASARRHGREASGDPIAFHPGITTATTVRLTGVPRKSRLEDVFMPEGWADGTQLGLSFHVHRSVLQNDFLSAFADVKIHMGGRMNQLVCTLVWLQLKKSIPLEEPAPMIDPSAFTIHFNVNQ